MTIPEHSLAEKDEMLRAAFARLSQRIAKSPWATSAAPFSQLREECRGLLAPDTILAWYRKLVAQKFDGSKKRGLAGRPQVDTAIEELVVKLARENSSWGYDRI